MSPAASDPPESEAAGSPRLRRALRTGRRVYLAALAVAATAAGAVYHDDVASLLADARPLNALAAAAASFGLIALGAAVWTVGLRALGDPVPLRYVTAATARALPARMVPVIGFAAARAALLRPHTSGYAALAAVAVLETAVSVSVALTAGIALLGISGTLPGGSLWAVAGAVAALTLGSPAIGGRAMTRLASRLGAPLAINWSGWWMIVVAEGAYWSWASTTFVLYLSAFPAADTFGAITTAGAFMTGWAVGFASVFAPQGAGVAEMATATLLDDSRSVVALAVLLVGYRLLLLARDLAAAAVVEIIATLRARRGSLPTG